MSTIEDRIRQRREAIRDRALSGALFPVPGYDGDLWIKLRFLPSRENDDINRAIPVPYDRMVHKLVVCCQGVYRSATGKREDAEQITVDGVPVRFDRLLAARYGFADEITINGDIQPADVVRGLMSDYLIEQLHLLWAAWMNASPEVEEDPVGESSAPSPRSDEPPSSS